MRRLGRILLNAATVLSLLLCVAAVVVWIRSYQSSRVYEIVRDRGDYRLQMTSDRGVFWIGETHHFEEWRVAYWKLVLLLALTPAIRTTRSYRRHRAASRRGLCPACGYDLRATPDQCPECGQVPAGR